MSGWVKLHRKIEDWEWYQDSKMVHLFVHMLLKANHDKKCWKGIEVLPGQFISGRLKLSEETGISEQTIRTCIKRLKSTSELTIKTTNKYSVFTLKNWNFYQSENELTSKLTNNQPTTNQQLTTNKNDKNEKKRNRGFSPPSVFDVGGYCKERANQINPNTFVDFYTAKNWMIGKNKMKDWKAAVRTWENDNTKRNQPVKAEQPF